MKVSPARVPPSARGGLCSAHLYATGPVAYECAEQSGPAGCARGLALGSGMTDDATTRQVVAQVARELDAQVPALTAELAALFLEQIPAFQGDEAVRELMAASTSSNLSTIFDVLLHGL